jgi:hypothetical protein
MNEYPVTHNNKNKEETIIKTILNNNNYPQNIIQQKQNSLNKNNKKENGPTSHFSDHKPEQLPNYLRILKLEYLTELKTT